MRRAILTFAVIGLVLGAAGTVAASHGDADNCDDADASHSENVDDVTVRANAWSSACTGASVEVHHPLIICDGPHKDAGPAHAQVFTGHGCESGAQVEA